jgi:hypothetical protein
VIEENNVFKNYENITTESENIENNLFSFSFKVKTLLYRMKTNGCWTKTMFSRTMKTSPLSLKTLKTTLFSFDYKTKTKRFNLKTSVCVMKTTKTPCWISSKTFKLANDAGLNN